MHSKIQLTSVHIINEDSLQINFAKNWYQEDIKSFTTFILGHLDAHHVIEVISGADREYCRFEWQQHYFVLNFECYSESCWIENETTPNFNLLTSIKQYLE